MCILFMYLGDKDTESDFSLILASNRDELYDRPAKKLAPWSEDPNVIGGRDLEAGCDGGTWLALSPLRKKIGVLLNLPGNLKPEAKTRGKIVADYLKSEITTDDYIERVRHYGRECNGFIFVTIELRSNVEVHTYSNTTNDLITWSEPCLGFSNSLPETPLKKVEGGKGIFRDICNKLNKDDVKSELIKELINFLRSDVRHLPDPQIEKRRPQIYQQLSSIFVTVPEGRYGTRTHTILLITKSGHVDVVEVTLQPPMDLSSPKWETTELQFELGSSKL